MSVNNTNYGLNSLKNNNGNDNSAFGAYSLYNSNSTSNNTAVGSNSLFFNTIGVNNTAIGAGSICNNTTGSLNTAVGSSALEGTIGVSVGDKNVAVGAQGLFNNTGNLNTALGAYAGLANTSQINNTFLGALTDLSSNNLAYTNSTALGYNAKIDASNQIVLGTSSEKVKIPGSYVGIGGVYSPASGFSLDVSGNVNVKGGNIDISGNGIIFPNGTQTQAYLGGGGSQWIDASNGIYYSAGTVGIGTSTPSSSFSLDVTGNARFTQDCSINSLTVGRGGGNIATNTAFGINALKANTTGNNNTAIGDDALQANTTGSNNTAIGTNALQTNNGSVNTAIGYLALRDNTTGANNTAIGEGALLENINGFSNTAIGLFALSNNTTGSTNTAIGNTAGATNITGQKNTFIGMSADCSSNYTNLENSTALGFLAIIDASDQIVLGNSSIGQLKCAVTSITALSDRRDKKDITPLETGINFIEKLQPVNFKWNMRDGGKIDIPEIGFIAQDLQEVQKETNTVIPNLVDEHNPEKLGAAYGTLLPVIVKAIQDLNNKNKELDNKNKELDNKNKELDKKNQELENRVKLLEDVNNN